MGSWCKSCHVQYNTERQLRNKVAINAKRRAEYDKLAYRLAHPLRAARCVRCMQEFETSQPRRIYCNDSCSRRSRLRDVNYPVRQRILARDGWHCYLCNRAIDPALPFPHVLSGSVDHVKPRAAGGSNDPSNLRAAHLACNLDKADKLLTEIWLPL